MEGTKPMIYIQVAFPKLKSDVVIPYLKSCSGSQSWLQGEIQDRLHPHRIFHCLPLCHFLHPHLISHPDVGPVSLSSIHSQGTIWSYLKTLLFQDSKDLIVFCHWT